MSPDTLVNTLRRNGLRIAITGAGSWLGQATLLLLEEMLGEAVAERVHLFGSAARPVTLPSGRVMESRALPAIADLPPADYLFLHYAFVTKGHVGSHSLSDYVRLNREIAETVEAAARRVCARGFFLPSSGAVYGPGRALRQSLEEHPYGFLKLEDEKRFADMSDEIGCRLSSIRVFNLAGPCINNLDSFALSSIIMSVLRGDTVRIRANKPVWRSYVHIMDLLGFAFREMIEGGALQPFDTAAPEAIEVGELATRIAHNMTGADYPIERPPVTEPEDCYVGDDVEFQRRLQHHGMRLCSLDIQIRDTVDDLRRRLSTNA